MELFKYKFKQYGPLENAAYRGVSNRIFYVIVYKLAIHINGDYFKYLFRSGKI